MEIKIKCPKCSWKPTSENLWQCTCNHIWNTFDTCAQCPKCKKNMGRYKLSKMPKME